MYYVCSTAAANSLGVDKKMQVAEKRQMKATLDRHDQGYACTTGLADRLLAKGALQPRGTPHAHMI